MTKTATLTANQAAVLDYFESNEEGLIGAIAAHVGKKPGALTSVLGSLHKRGLIDVSDHDGHALYSRRPAPTAEVADDGLAVHGDSPGTKVLTEDVETAATKGRELQATGAAREATPKGSWKTITVGHAYLTTDGAYVTAKDTLDAQPKMPWALYQIDQTGVTFVAVAKSSTAALAIIED